MDLSEERTAVRLTVKGVMDRAVCEMDESAVVELVNYTHHYGVRDLDDESISKVVAKIGELAEQAAIKGGRRRVGGGDVRAVTHYLCNLVYKHCQGVADRILVDRVALTDDHMDRIARLAAEHLEEA